MIERLKEVPFQDFSLTFRKFEKARWNSTEYDYMFQVERQKVLNQDCGPEDDFKVIKKETNDVLVVPCLNLKETKPFRFASFIRSGNEDKVRIRAKNNIFSIGFQFFILRLWNCFRKWQQRCLALAWRTLMAVT